MVVEAVRNAVMGWAERVLDIWFKDSLLLPLAKGLLRANADKIDSVLSMFADGEGNVDIDSMLSQYEAMIPEQGYHIELSKLIGDNFLTRSIGIKVLERSDIKELKELLKDDNRIRGTIKG
jgi:hypothetical protein